MKYSTKSCTKRFAQVMYVTGKLERGSFVLCYIQMHRTSAVRKFETIYQLAKLIKKQLREIGYLITYVYLNKT